MSVTIGQSAPNFTLVDTNKKETSLSNFKGQNVVLAFFPLAFTGVCTTELCSLRDNISKYDNLNAKVLGISVDSPFTLEKFKNEQNLNFELLSDFNKTTASAYGSLYDNFLLGMQGVAKRSVFVIDKEGVVRHSEIMEDAHDIPNFDKVQEVLKTLS